MKKDTDAPAVLIDPKDLEKIAGPKYQAIVMMIEQAMRDGRLKENDRLPPQRNLARQLGVTVGTITRAFTEAELKGLVRGEVGRGTYVIPNEHTSPSSLDEVDITGNEITYGVDEYGRERKAEETSVFERTNLLADCVSLSPVTDAAGLINKHLQALQRTPDFDRLFDYTKPGFMEGARESVARMLSDSGIDCTKNSIILTCGAQHALSIVTAGTSEPGDIILSESLTYQGVQAMASRLHRRQMIGIDIDEYGMVPEHLAQVCARYKPRSIITVPNQHNPTGITVPESRRRAIAEIASQYNVLVIEDDVNRYLIEQPPISYRELLPEQTFHIGSLSKAISPGLRIGYIVAPKQHVMRLRSALRSSVWMVPPLLTKLGKRIIDSGDLSDFFALERNEIHRRQQIASEIFDNDSMQYHTDAKHIWLTLPEWWDALHFTSEAQKEGIAVLPSWLFSLNRDAAPEAIRVSLSGTRNEQKLRSALLNIREIMRQKR